METPSTFTPQERWQSIKAALLCGIAAGTVAALLTGLHRWQSLGIPEVWMSLRGGLSGWSFWIGAVIAGISGGVFGLTYRYAVRCDQNPQLKSGVVLAFGLVRGLALVDVASALSQGWPWLVGVAESLLLFAIAGRSLDWAMERHWIQPFGKDR